MIAWTQRFRSSCFCYCFCICFNCTVIAHLLDHSVDVWKSNEKKKWIHISRLLYHIITHPNPIHGQWNKWIATQTGLWNARCCVSLLLSFSLKYRKTVSCIFNNKYYYNHKITDNFMMKIRTRSNLSESTQFIKNNH